MEQLCRYVGFTEEDTEPLRRLRPIIHPLAPEVAEHYGAILQDPGVAAVLESPEQVERLKKSLERWIRRSCRSNTCSPP